MAQGNKKNVDKESIGYKAGEKFTIVVAICAAILVIAITVKLARVIVGF